MRGEAGSSQPAISTPSKSGGSDDFVRLHISPFDQDLLKVVIPASILPSARNISFHTIETFPERRYGFVDLPAMDAEKIKKKLNGSTLKGTKVKVDKARPAVEIVPTGDADVPEKKRKKKASKDGVEGSKKRKRDPELVEGVSLNGRKVKRGWTEPVEHKRKKKSKKDEDGKSQEKRKRLKSKYTDQEECLLKTRVPPNATINLPQSDEPKKKKRKSKGREVTVHEFEKTTKFPGFLKNDAKATDSKPAVEFIEGKGWVDAEGNVVEAAKEDSRKTTKPRAKQAVVKPAVESEDDSTSSSGTSSESESDEEEEEEDDKDEEEEEEEQPTEGDNKTPQKKSGKVLEERALAQNATPASATKADPPRPISSSSSRSLTIKIPPPITPSATKVHPLEALYKRQKADENATQMPAKDAPFSFFGSGPNADEEDEEVGQPVSEVMPMTPYSRQDFEWRNVRSAAPTPDTAHPSRMRNFWAPEDGDEDEDEDMGDAPNAGEAGNEQEQGEEEEGEEDAEEDGSGKGKPTATTDFQNWFWENRRDLNRSWMTRRKTATKEKRYRENKARASKAV